MTRIETTEKAIRRLITKLGGPEGLAVAAVVDAEAPRVGQPTAAARRLIAAIGDFARFSHPRELASWLGITQPRTPPARANTAATSPKPATATPAASWLRPPGTTPRPPRRPASGAVTERAWNAQVRLHHRYRHLTAQGKRPTVTTVAVARELAGFIWAELTDQPLRQEAAA